MTIKEIRESDKAWITPKVAAGVLNCDPMYIRIAARDFPERLGFPVTRIGNRTKIPRIPFLRYLGYETKGE